MSESPPGPVDEHLDRIRRDLRRSSELLVCLDFDGTLAPIVEDPDEASATEETEEALEKLGEEDAVSTAVVSGRALEDVRERVDTPETFAGNHGLELERDGSVEIHPKARRQAALVGETCALLEVVLDSIPGTRVEDKRLTGTVHVRTVPEPARPIVRQLTRDAVELIGDGELETSTGKRVIEISPSVSWGKGDAVSLIEEEKPDETFVVYVGDDVTDESAFRAVEPDGVGVRVGDQRPTAASCRVGSPSDVASFLRWLASVGAEEVESDAESIGP